MDYTIKFIFNAKLYPATILLDFKETPCFVYAYLKDPGLISRFGTDIDIKTDCYKVLPGKILDPGLLELKAAIFNVVKNTEQFQMERARSGQLYRLN
ncbi:MAG TPA: hypothetical protein VGC29_05420 [Flavisolibacter sp.]